MTDKEIIEINSYFKNFLMEHIDGFSKESSRETVNGIGNQENIDFSKDWNYLILLMETIEHVYDFKSIVTEKNYFRFEFHDGENIQDKGSTKIEALYSCIYQTLRKFWGRNPPNFNRGVEPFDEIDLG